MSSVPTADSAFDRAIANFDAVLVAAQAWHRARLAFESQVGVGDADELKRTHAVLTAAEERLAFALEEMDR